MNDIRPRIDNPAWAEHLADAIGDEVIADPLSHPIDLAVWWFPEAVTPAQGDAIGNNNLQIAALTFVGLDNQPEPGHRSGVRSVARSYGTSIVYGLDHRTGAWSRRAAQAAAAMGLDDYHHLLAAAFAGEVSRKWFWELPRTDHIHPSVDCKPDQPIFRLRIDPRLMLANMLQLALRGEGERSSDAVGYANGCTLGDVIGRGDASPAPKAAPAAAPEGSSPDIIRKLDALLMTSKYRQAAGRFGWWEARNSAHNNQIVGRLLDALPEVSSRDAARILGVKSHSQVTRTDTWKQRRADDGPDATSYAEHHQNMQYDEDARAQDPAKVVATREQQAAQLRKVIIELGMTSMFRGIDDDAKLLDDLEKLSRKNPAAFKRISDRWVVQCTAPHQPEDS